MERKILFWVVALHAALIFLMLLSPTRNFSPPKKHVAVRTLNARQTAPKKVGRETSSSGSSIVHAPKSKPKATPKKPSPKTETKPKVKPKAPSNTKPIVVDNQNKKKPPPKKAEPHKDTQGPLAKIEEKKEKVYPKTQLEVPALLPTSRASEPFAPFVFEEAAATLTFEEQLINYLHETLHLPEVGEVKIELTLQKNGMVEKLVVLYAESLKNKAYLEKNLPLLKLPCMEKKETLVFTFCNE